MTAAGDVVPVRYRCPLQLPIPFLCGPAAGRAGGRAVKAAHSGTAGMCRGAGRGRRGAAAAVRRRCCVAAAPRGAGGNPRVRTKLGDSYPGF